MGITSDTFERARALLDAGADAIVIDTAHGHSAGVIRKLKKSAKRSPDATLIAGMWRRRRHTSPYSKQA